MKKVCCFLMLTALCTVLGCRFNSNSGSQSISFSKTEESYQFMAEFPDEKSSKVFGYIESELEVKNLSKEDRDVAIKLPEGPSFHLKSKLGFVEIKFNKRENSEASWHKLEQLCKGIKEKLER